MKKLMLILLLCIVMVPAMSQNEKSHILIYKIDSTVDTLLLNNVRDIYHSRLDANGVEQPDVSTLRLRTVDGERVYPLTEIDYVVMPKSGRIISFMGTSQSESTSVNGPKKTSVSGNFPGQAGDVVTYKWVSDDFIYLSTGDKSNRVSTSNGSTTGHFSFQSDSLIADQYIVYYPGTTATAYNKVTIPTTQTQTKANNSDHLGKSGDCGTATAIRQPNSNYSFALDHKTAVICFMPRVDTLNTLVLKHVAVKANKDIAGTFTLSPEGVTLDSGTGQDTITLNTSNFIMPHQKATAQDSVASYMVVAPQSEKTTMKVYYRVYDTKSELDTIVVKNVSINKIEGAKVYPVTSIIPVRMFLAAYTDSVKWDFNQPATLYGSVNLPVESVGFIWGYKKDLNPDNMQADIPLSHDADLKFSDIAVAQVKQKPYFFRAYAKEGDKTYWGKIKKFGMDREIVDLGTSVRWSSINMGAITAEDPGDLYAWGELNTKSSYTQNNYEYYDSSTKQYQNIGVDFSGNPQYDVVAAKWRGCWRMPTSSELGELRGRYWKGASQTSQDGTEQPGYLYKNPNNDNTIFIPKQGYDYFLWSSTIVNNNPTANTAVALYYANTWLNQQRYAGGYIRPVFESNITTDKDEYLFIHTDSISYSADHTSTNMYGTMRGMDDDITDIIEGFVIGSSADVELDSEASILKTVLTKQADDNGSYHLPLSAEDMDKLDLGTTYYVRSYLTYDGQTYYGNALAMDAMTLTTDSTNWAVGMDEARLCATVTGITESARSTVELGFVIGYDENVKLGNGTELTCDSVVNGKFVCELKNMDLKQYYYCAFIRQGGRVFYGNVKMLGLEMVDLGLPSGLRWANINVGSQTPMNEGNFYAWGETTTKNQYSQSQYTYYQNNQYVSIGSDIAGTLYDAAQVNWQSVWRMPSKSDVQELIANTTWSSTSMNGTAGVKLTSKLNGKSIFIPFSGYRVENGSTDTTWRLIQWTSSQSSATGASIFDNYHSSSSDRTPYVNGANRYLGLTIRPVAKYNYVLDDESMIQMTTDSVKWEVGQTEATLYGYLLGLRYNSNATESGFAYATTENINENTPGVQYLKTNEGETHRVSNGAFNAKLTDVEDGTIYYYRAYVKVGDKYYFANERQFGRRMVDLGLPSKLLWSNINLGASSPDDNGDYYAWGETETKSEFNAPSTYEDLGVDISGSRHDAAHVNWGGIWRMPTKSDIEELLSKCTWTEVNKYGRAMYKVVGPSGDSIFIAKRGFKNGTSVSNDGTKASFWSSNLNNVEDVNNKNAYGTDFKGINHDIASVARYLGYTIRPVAKYNYEPGDDKIYVTTNGSDWEVGNREVHLVGNVSSTSNMAGATRGFVVGYQTDPVYGGQDVTNVEATASDVDDTFTGTINYPADTTYYYRAYVKIGDQYYYGETRRYGLELVDLGYGIKWASINMGAQISSDYGSRYAWGETTSKSNYTQSSYTYHDNGYVDIGADISNTRHDAAKSEWGGTWRMPTHAEMKALVDSCQWTWTTVDGQAGYQVTGKEGKSIFLPANGYQNASYYEAIGTECYYWTSSISNDAQAWYLHGTATTNATSDIDRFYGLAIRPVTTVGTEEGGGGDITGGHKQGGSQQTGGEGTGGGNAGTGNTGGTVIGD